VSSLLGGSGKPWPWFNREVTKTIGNGLNKVRPSMPLKIGGRFTQTNKNQPRVIHYKNNFFFFF